MNFENYNDAEDETIELYQDEEMPSALFLPAISTQQDAVQYQKEIE